MPRLETPIAAWGYAQADSGEFDGLRKRLPVWAPEGMPAHFFRYSDEQTILAAWAIDDAMRRSGIKVEQTTEWGIIAAPEFLGRQQVVGFLDRFNRNGAPRVSPNSIIQHSLHSVSGTLSILLTSRGPNVGTGGGREAFAEGLLAALTLFELQSTSGSWLVATAWDPPPLPDAQGDCAPSARCHAIALALRGKGTSTLGSLTLCDDVDHERSPLAGDSPLSVPNLVRALARCDARTGPQELTWRLPWGATLGLNLKSPAIGLRRAA